MKNTVCFAGHSLEFRCVGVQDKVKEVVEGLIKEGYTTFFDGNRGAFDNLCANVVAGLKFKYQSVKIYRVVCSVPSKKEQDNLMPCFDGFVSAGLEKVYPKQLILKRNRWIVDNSDVVVCHIENTCRSGASKTVDYALRCGKKVIYV